MILSVIVPVYNVARYLRKGLDSVVNQIVTLGTDEVEIVVVNDGSTDDSLRIAREYERHYSFIQVVDKPNGGLSSARNAGMNVMRGDWVLFFDPDDALVAGSVSYLLKTIHDSRADAVIYALQIVSLQDADVPLNIGTISRFDLRNRRDGVEFVRSVYIGASNCCYRTSALSGLRFLEGLAVAEDTLFGMKALCRLSEVEVHATVLYKYFQREGSILHTVSVGRIRGCAEVAVLLWSVSKEYRWYEDCRAIFFRKARIAAVGDGIGLLRQLPADKRRVEWHNYFSKLSPEFGHVEKIDTPVFFIYRLVFRLQSPLLAVLLLHLPYVASQKLLKNKLLLRIWKAIR